MQNGFQALGEAVGLLLQPHLVLYHACRISFQLLILPAAQFHDCMHVWPYSNTQGFCSWCTVPFQLLILPAALLLDCMHACLCSHTQGLCTWCTSANMWHLPVTVLITSLTHVGQEWSLLKQRAELAPCQHSWTPAPVSVQLPKCLGQCFHAQEVSYRSTLSPV